MKKSSASAQQAFTLIELMISITLASILLMMGSSLTQRWVDRSQVNNTISIMQNTMSQAKAAALRNPYNSTTNSPAVHVCLDQSSNSLHIIRTKSNTSSPCDLTATDNTVLQSTALARGISIKHGTHLFACLSFNSRGMLTANSDPNCSTLTHLDFEVIKNHETALIKIL